MEHLQKNTYVDDIQCSADSKEELIRFKEKSKTIMAEGGFTLHKWHSKAQIADHDEKMCREINTEETYAKTIVGTHADETKILGILWNKLNDKIEICFKPCIQSLDGEIVTKRKMLLAINGIFDPLGIAAPVIIVGKIIYSEVCLLKVSWDEELPKDIQDRWNQWKKKLEQCTDISIPRSVTKGKPSKIIVHGFSDASKLAVAVAVYVVSHYESIQAESRLLVAKSRIASRDTSIPRLELTAAHMLSRLMGHLKITLSDCTISEFHGWVDSTTVLYWLQDQGRWTQYVRNRTKAIQEKDFIQWHYVPTDENPADLGSRGVSPKKLDQFWKEGPPWLANNEQWPKQPEVQETSQSLKEKLVSKEKQLKATEPEANSLETLLLKHPYNKMLRITAYIMQFIRRCQRNEIASDNFITVEEIETAETVWIKRAQEQIEETKDCHLTKDECGVMRYNGRIPSYHPIWLPRNHKLTELIIAANHKKVLHNGIAATMASVRDRFWVPRLRTVVKKLVRECSWCKRFSAKPLNPPVKSMLPEFRVVMDEPFAVTGVDFAGPIEYKQKKNTVGKAYVALFTCASTRAVHLKLCKDMTAEEFKIAFKEFMARRGTPRMMISDNAKTFITTSKWLKKLKSDHTLMNYQAEKRTSWRFNMATAPWWGGFFERLVGIMKKSLAKMIGKGRLHFHELEEILLDVELAMNNQPICYQGEEFDQPVITPNLLIRGGHSIPLKDDFDNMEPLKRSTKRLIHLHKTKEQLRKRWTGEYIKALEERRRYQSDKSHEIPQEGSVVLLKDDVKNKAHWKIGRIVKYIRGSDSTVRGFKIRLGNGYIVERPLQLVCDLEIRRDAQETPLNPEAPIFVPKPCQNTSQISRPHRQAKSNAKNQIMGVAL